MKNKDKKKKLSVSVITLFPEFIETYTSFGIIKRAIALKLFELKAINLRKFGLDARGTVDDRPYGGGVGMVLRPDVVFAAIKAARSKKLESRSKERVIMLSPQGKVFNQGHAKRLAQYDKLIFVCGRYEGFDERVRKFVDEEISIGDYVLMGGELPALVITEAVSRLIPGILGKLESTANESFSNSSLEYPQYTKPEVWTVKLKTKTGKDKIQNLRVPKVLLSGNHANVNTWRAEESLKRTTKRRPDLLNHQN